MASLGTQASGKLLDYEQFIDHQIGLTRARIKMTDVLTAGVLLLVASLGILFLEVVLDHIFGLPLMVRQVVLVVGLAAALTFAAMRIARPMFGRVNGLYAARTIESTDPTFKNSIINYLELRKRRGEMSRTIMAAVEAKAVDDLAKIEVDTVVNQKRLIQTVYVLAGLVTLICAYALMTPKSIFDSVNRAFLADLARPTNTRLTNIRPGDDPKLARVSASSKVTFETEVMGARPKAVTLHVSTDGGKNYLNREMKVGKYDKWSHDEVNVQQPIDYYLTAADAVSRTYHLDVQPEPMVVEVQHDLDFPTYTKSPRRAGIPGGNVEALEGTIVTIHARTNEPVDSAHITLTRPDPKARDGQNWKTAEEVSGSAASDNDHEIIVRFKLTASGQYKVHFKDQRRPGESEPDAPPAHGAEGQPADCPVRAARPPRAEGSGQCQGASADQGVGRFRGPRGHALRRPEERREDRGRSASQELPGAQRTRSSSLAQDEVIDLAALKARPGTVFEYWAVVRDTREPHANKVETGHQTIEATEPAAKKDLQSVENPKNLDEPQKSDDAEEDDAKPNNAPQDPSDEAQKSKDASAKGRDGADDSGKANEARDNTGKGNDRDAADDNAKPQPDKEPSAEDQKRLAALEKAINKRNPRNTAPKNPANAQKNNANQPQDPQNSAGKQPDAAKADPNAAPPRPARPRTRPRRNRQAASLRITSRNRLRRTGRLATPVRRSRAATRGRPATLRRTATPARSRWISRTARPTLQTTQTFGQARERVNEVAGFRRCQAGKPGGQAQRRIGQSGRLDQARRPEPAAQRFRWRAEEECS